MPLGDYQFSYRGVTFGLDLPLGVMKVTGLEDLSVSSGDVSIPRGDGDIAGLHTVKSKQIILELAATGDKRSQALADTLAAAFRVFQRSDESFPLSFKEPGFPERQIYVRVISRNIPRDSTLTFGYRPFTVRLIASDPRIYGASEANKTLGIFDGTGGGAEAPFDFDVEFAVDTSSQVVLVNNGDTDAFPLLRFYGPTTGTITAVKLTNLETSQVIEFSTTLTTGQTLTADMNRIVTVDTSLVPFIHLDGSNRYGDWTVPRKPFALQPGANTIRFEITGTSTDAQSVITYRDTYL